ncbi:MAG: tetratricopeptide repeat protein [Verrucomicrobiae bacterium]
MKSRPFRLNSLPTVTALVIAGSVILMVLLIPDRNQVLERALKDRDFPRIEKLLAATTGGGDAAKPALHAVLAAWLDLNTTVSSLDGKGLDEAAAQRLSRQFLPLVGDRAVAQVAREGLAETIAHAGSADEIAKIAGEISVAIPAGELASFWRMVESTAKRTGNLLAEASAVQALSDGSQQTALRLAGLWIRSGRPEEAVAALKAGLDSFPTSAAGRELASLYLNLLRQENRNSEALDFLLTRRGEALLPGSELPEMIARTSLACGRSAEALPALEEWLRAHPDSAEVWLLLSDIAMGAGDQGLAARALDRYLRLRPDDDAKKMARAKVFEWSGQPGEAVDLYLPLAAGGSRPALDRVIALAPGLHREAELAGVLPRFLPESGTNPDVLALASLLVVAGDYEGARKLFLRHLAAKPDDLAAIRSLAEIDMTDQLFDEASDLYVRARELAPEDLEIEHRLVRLEWLAGRYEGVLDRLRKLASQTHAPDIIQEFYSAAESLGDIPGLVEAMELKIAYDPETQADTYRNLAYYNTLLGRSDDSRRALARGRGKFPKSPFFREELASRLAADGDIAGALKELEGRVGPESQSELKSLYAFLLAQSGRQKAAIKFLQESLSETERRDPEMLELSGGLLESEGRFREAEAVYREAVRVAPGRPGFQLALARALGAQKRGREMQSVLAGIDLTRHPDAARDAAQAYLDIENYRDASAILRRYLAGAAGSGDSLAWRMLGDATLSTGDPERAKRAYRRSLQLVLQETRNP